MWRMMWMMPGVQLKCWKIGKWRWRMMVGVRDHQRLELMGRIDHKIPTVMKRILRTKAPRPPPNILGGCGGKFKCSK